MGEIENEKNKGRIEKIKKKLHLLLPNQSGPTRGPSLKHAS